MSQHKIVLVTIGFPYGTGENFIPAEIDVLPKNMELDIVPYMLPIKPAPRAVPSKVKIINSCSVCQNNFYKLKYVLKALCSKDLYAEIKKNHITSPQAIKKIIGYYARAIELSEHLENVYKQELAEGTVTFYSYWLLEGAFAISMLKKRYHIPCYSRAHGVDVWKGMSVYGEVPFRGYTLQNLNAVYVCSKSGRQYLQNRYPAFSGKFKTGYLGTLDHGWQPEYHRSDRFVIVSCARIEPVKRVALLVQALSKISSQQIQWVHFGDGSERKQVELEMKDLPENVSVSLMGNTPHEEIMKYYAQNRVDLFVNTSSSEGVPVSIMEAISFGIPVIATDVGGTNEIVNSETGTLMRADFSGEELADNICRYIQFDEAQYAEIRRKARAFWEDNFSATKNYQAFYNEITGENNEC